MNVRVVCQNTGDHVLARMAAALAKINGWSLNRRPDKRADFNFYLPYLYFNTAGTGTAAYFTHLERWGRKLDQWKAVDHAVDVRVVTARRYLRNLTGVKTAVRPPIDRDKFTPRWLGARPENPVVGVSGMVYRTGRKGEGLIDRLASSALAANIQLTGSGRGWSSIITQYYEWAAMQDFYRSLDVFVCASKIEGVPMPPLEALSCGVPVVIPREVGMLDDLPDAEGVYRYHAGDYDDLCAALERAVSGSARIDEQTWKRRAEALRALTEPYTAANWAKDCREALMLTDVVETPRAVERETVELFTPISRKYGEWADRAGLYTVAYGAAARECAKRLLASWRRWMPGIPVMIATDKPDEFFDTAHHVVNLPRPDIGARLPKLRMYEVTPKDWEYVLYLDADCELMQPVDFLYDGLFAGWKLVICKNPDKYHTTREMARPNNREEVEETWRQMGSDDLLQLNGGVIGFRRDPAVEAMFERWIEGWQQQANQDQPALHRAIYADPLPMLVLGNEFNCSTRYAEGHEREVIRHFQTEAREIGLRKLPPGVRGDSRRAWQAVGAEPPAGAT